MANKPNNTDVDDYIAHIPIDALDTFNELRSIVKKIIPEANEVRSYGIIGYKIDAKRALVFIAGGRDHVAMYPIPHDESLQEQLKPYTKGKGTLWFKLNEPLPVALIRQAIQSLVTRK